MTEAKIRLSESATTITAVCYPRDIAGLERTKMWRKVWVWLLVASLPETCWPAGPRLSVVAITESRKPECGTRAGYPRGFASCAMFDK
jgi:hypothetical protein